MTITPMIMPRPKRPRSVRRGAGRGRRRHAPTLSKATTKRAHDARHDEEHALENAAHADDAPHAEHSGEEYAAVHEDRGPAAEGERTGR